MPTNSKLIEAGKQCQIAICKFDDITQKFTCRGILLHLKDPKMFEIFLSNHVTIPILSLDVYALWKPIVYFCVPSGRTGDGCEYSLGTSLFFL